MPIFEKGELSRKFANLCDCRTRTNQTCQGKLGRMYRALQSHSKPLFSQCRMLPNCWISPHSGLHMRHNLVGIVSVLPEFYFCCQFFPKSDFEIFCILTFRPEMKLNRIVSTNHQTRSFPQHFICHFYAFYYTKENNSLQEVSQIFRSQIIFGMENS